MMKRKGTKLRSKFGRSPFNKNTSNTIGLIEKLLQTHLGTIESIAGGEFFVPIF